MFNAAAPWYGSGMRITCPSCAATYDVPDERLAPGRTVKCAQCGTGWAPVVAVLRTTPPEPPPPPAPEPEPEPEPPAEPLPNLAPVIERFTKPPAPPAPPAPRPPAPKPATPPDTAAAAVTAGWVASIGLLLLLAGAAYAWRAEVMQAWPASERAYALLGLAGR